MKQTSIEKIRLGIFVILGSLLIIVAAYLIGNRQNMFGKTFKLTAVFHNVNGLQKGNNVRFSGINVGTVKELEMVDDKTIRVHMIIEQEIQSHLRKDAIATIGSDGLVGSMLINITPGQGNSSSVESGDEIETYSRIDTDELMSTLSMSNENIALLTKDLLELTQSLNAGQGTLGMLLKDSVAAQRIDNILSQLEGTSYSANLMMKELHEIAAGIQTKDNIAHVLLDDTASASRLKAMIENLEGASQGMEVMTNELDEVIKKLNEGEGALSYLATDTAFSASLGRTMTQVERGSILLNEDLEALQHSFLFRNYFKKRAKEEKKKN